jgi:hypothetical protein
MELELVNAVNQNVNCVPKLWLPSHEPDRFRRKL